MEVVMIVSVATFFLFVAPIWIIMHYLSKMRNNKTMSLDEEEKLYTIWEQSQRMEKRLLVLEKILDESDADWERKDHES